ncbi:gliding motility-associated C-terminal domain-containing protein [Maribacter sp. MAR_2009_72]|uniref:Ig-like domain-containing protein n=1 Tax=Maribacter sp. MAR_2009_72 TaxID=1250050 RepID=UPI00119A0F61|nr:gliding motility-associated C-terminal domain-containing protein [Maribacter sp. MAR_2009_72]TVZ17197.1 gliding motility-associated-like protein [Maribacter sp. MAR_2009_72]
MEKNYPNSFLLIFALISMLIGAEVAFGQQQFAQTISSESQVDFSNRAIDDDLSTHATIRANSGLVLGLGAYSGHLELEYANEIPALQTSYVRLDTEDELLPFLLGGNLGGLLADVVGVVILGNQEFSVEVKNDNTVILTNDSAISSAFTTDQMRVVTNENGEYFLSISPNSAYNRIRFTNRTGSLVGLGSEKSLDVYGAFMDNTTLGNCLNAAYTSFDGTGITLDLLQLSGAGVSNPELAIDDTSDTYAEMGFGIVGVAASLSQTFYFDTVSNADDVFYITLGVDPSLLQVGLLNNIEIRANNGSSAAVFQEDANNLLNLDLLGLLAENGTVDVPIAPGVPIDRLTLELSSLVGIGLDQRIRIYDVRKAPAEPTLDTNMTNTTICAGTEANLVALASDELNEELVWFNADGAQLQVLDSGEPFVPTNLTETTTFFVAARDKGCTDLSSLLEVVVNVVPVPTADDINVAITNDGICETGTLTLTPTSTIAGAFKWFLDAGAVNEITNGEVVNGVTYTIGSNGVLDITGLQENFDTFSVYARLIEESASCENAPGDLREVTVSVTETGLEASLLLNTVDFISELLNLSSANEITIDSQEISICSGTSVDILATLENNVDLEIRWYDALSGGNLLDTVESGASFDTGILNADTTFYVAVGRIGCLLETAKATININVLDRPTADDINVFGADGPICSSSDVVLVPSSAISGSYQWYFDENKTNPIVDGMVVGNVSYAVSDSGTLTISGLSDINSPYNFYVGLERAVAGCDNVNGELKEVAVTIMDSNFTAVPTLETVISLQDVYDINTENSAIQLEGSVTGDVAQGDELTLQVNGTEYIGTLDQNLEYSVAVNGLDVLLDADQEVELTISSGGCNSSYQLPLPIPELPLGNVVQVFCASDNPTLLDLELSLVDGVLFNALVGGSVLGMDTPLVDGQVYYMGLLNIPISVYARIGIAVSVITVDAPTTTNDAQTFCENTNPLIGDLEVDQDNVVFYDSPENGTMLDPTDPLVSGDYYVSSIENGCESEDRLHINATVFEDTSIVLNGELTDACMERSYTYTTVSGQENYVWAVNGGTITEGGTATDDYVTVTWTSLENTSIQVSFTSANGCAENTSMTQEIATKSCGEVLGAEFCLEVFNEFSPNADGYNDFFEIECITDYANTLQIYNRNGNLVFETQDYQNNWDGIANVNGVIGAGEHLPAGTYYYVVNIPELNRDLVGWLQLAR